MWSWLKSRCNPVIVGHDLVVPLTLPSVDDVTDGLTLGLTHAWDVLHKLLIRVVPAVVVGMDYFHKSGKWIHGFYKHFQTLLGGTVNHVFGAP